MSYARPVAARSSIAWTFDETRATMQELRRQLQIEKEVSRDAERERDELARELRWSVRAEQAARSEVQQALEAQRDAAAARARRRPRARATRADAASEGSPKSSRRLMRILRRANGRLNKTPSASNWRPTRVAAAERDKAEAEAELLALRDEAAALRARVAQLEKVKITSGLAAKIQKVVQERDELLAAARKGGRFNLNDENAAPFGAEDLSSAGGECRQSAAPIPPPCRCCRCSAPCTSSGRVDGVEPRLQFAFVSVAVGRRALPADRGKSTDGDLSHGPSQCAVAGETPVSPTRWAMDPS